MPSIDWGSAGFAAAIIALACAVILLTSILVAPTSP